MADQDEAGEGGKPRRKRPVKPGPGTIDLEAKDMTPEPEPAGAEPPPPPSEAEPRSPIGALIAAAAAGAAIGILAFVLLLTTEVIPLPGADPALGSRVAALEKELAEAPQPQPPPPAADDSALREEIAGLKTALAEIRNAPPPAPADNTALIGRISALETKIADAARSQTGSASTAALEQLAVRVDDLARRQAEAPPPDPGVEAAAASAQRAEALAAVAALESTIARGAPFASALTALDRKLPDADTGALAAHAQSGLEPARILGTRLAAALADAPPPPSTASGFVDRMAEGARNLVRVRPVDGGVPQISDDDPWSARSAVAARLDQGDYAAALTDWDRLDAAAKQATEDEAEALRARLAADAALDELRATALGAGAEPAP